jgi:surface antigen
MRTLKTGTRALLLGSALLFSCPLLAGNADAAQHNRPDGNLLQQTVSFRGYPVNSRLTLASGANLSYAMHTSHAMRLAHDTHGAGLRFAARSYGISCVPYARQVSGIMVAGNAWQWWDNAEGLYARGDRPEAGSVLNFRANGRMRLGHVAVVSQVVNAREVIVDHANWPGGGGRGGVSHGVTVVDVSEANNWSAVRVELGRSGEFGSVYPTYGFIYNRPDAGYVTASVTRPAAQPVINRVPSDLRPAAERPWHTVEEVAEAPSSHRIDMKITTTGVSSGQ